MSNKIKAIMTGTSLTVVLSDGTMLINNAANIELFNKVRNCNNEDQVLILMAPELSEERKIEKEEIALNKQIVNNFSILTDTGDFEVEDNCVYLKGIKRSLPKELVKKFIEVVNTADKEFNREEYQALKNFWYWLVLNPNSEAVEGTFEFINRKNFKIMKNGFLLAYRWVKSKGSDNEALVKFVSNEYIKIKTKHKKSPANYNVWEYVDGTLKVEKLGNDPNDPNDEDYVWGCKGSLQELYLELPTLQEDIFTDGYTGKMSIKISEEVRIDRKVADESRKTTCSSGLHFCRQLADYQSFGDVALLVAINPINIVSVPEGASSKARCCAYMPLAVLSSEDHNILDDADTLELLEEYNSSEVEKLEELAQESTIQDLKKNYIISDIKQSTFNTVLNNLKDEISNRIVKIS